MIQRYDPRGGDTCGINVDCMEKQSDGDYVLYADAEKWVQAEIDERDRTISRLNNDLCDRRISLEVALKLCKEKDEEIAALKFLVDDVIDIVVIYPAESPDQKEWRDNCLAKAREVLK